MGAVRPMASALGTRVAVFRYERLGGIEVLDQAA
jgi:hypothetical protein